MDCVIDQSASCIKQQTLTGMLPKLHQECSCQDLVVQYNGVNLSRYISNCQLIMRVVENRQVKKNKIDTNASPAKIETTALGS
jgi:hypothetical protein